jgi:hypothetical protein
VYQFVVGFQALADSNFITAAVGSLAGAFGGAWAAQRIAGRTKLREDLLKEIRNTNAAISMLYGIATAHLGLKKQYVKALRDNHAEERERLLLFQRAQQAGTVPPQQVFHFHADLQSLNPLHSPEEALQRLLFDQMSLPGAELFLTSLLLSSMKYLTKALLDRNSLIDAWRTNQPKDLTSVYFGSPQDGVEDRRYGATVEAIYRQTDDVIAFSMMIAGALFERGKATRKKFRNRFHVDGPPINKTDFTRFKDLLPSFRRNVGDRPRGIAK